MLGELDLLLEQSKLHVIVVLELLAYLRVVAVLEHRQLQQRHAHLLVHLVHALQRTVIVWRGACIPYTSAKVSKRVMQNTL